MLTKWLVSVTQTGYGLTDAAVLIQSGNPTNLHKERLLAPLSTYIVQSLHKTTEHRYIPLIKTEIFSNI